MRELIAKRIALSTGLLVVLMAIGFATLQNHIRTGRPLTLEPIEPLPIEAIDQQAIEKGKAVYEAEFCATCHSIAGQGHERHPLDGVGARLRADEIHLWIAPSDELESKLPDRVYKTKQRFHELSADELDALVQYMRSLR